MVAVTVCELVVRQFMDDLSLTGLAPEEPKRAQVPSRSRPRGCCVASPQAWHQPVSAAGAPRVVGAEGGGKLRLIDVDADEDGEQRDEHEGEELSQLSRAIPTPRKASRPPV